jgi:hypothetical protein
MQPEANVPTHLRPQAPPVDLACPGLMIAANISLVLGYLWVGWISGGSHLGQPLELLRGAVLPFLLAVLIVALRPTFMRRQLLGGTWLLPIAAAVEVGAALVADTTEGHVAAQSAGAMALLFAIVAIGSVLTREVARRSPRPSPEPVAQPAIAQYRDVVTKPTFVRPAANLDLVGSSAVHQ